MLAGTEAVAMNTQLWVCGYVLLAATLLNAQEVPAVRSENLENAVANRSLPFVDLLREAEAGNASAQYSVANAYGIGNVVPKNDAEAVRWWLQAARKGFAKAQNRMGFLYEHGMGVPRDYGEAVRWFSIVAEQKLPEAQYNLAQMYQHGEGVQRDDAHAIDLYGQAAAQGLASARNQLGWHIYVVMACRGMRLKPLTFSMSRQSRGSRPRNIIWE